MTPAPDLYALNYGVDRVRFLTPVMAGQRVRCRAVLTALEPRADRSWRCTTTNTLEVAGAQRPAMVADWITYFAPRSGPTAAAR
jgi:acyl dehydratase